MFKLIVVTLAAFVAILQIFGDPARRPDVTRVVGDGFTLATFVGFSGEDDELAPRATPLMSDGEAIQRALEAGRIARNERTTAPRQVALRAVSDKLEEVAAPTYWYVSGNRVNLRQGPGTGNAVVAQVTLGTEAEVLDARDGWMQIVTRDGATSGWISGKFLKEQKPG